MTLVRAVAAWLCLGVLGSSGALADTAGRAVRAEPARADNTADTSRQILVTFADEREGRVPVGESTSIYRQRGDYANSTWSERHAADLAKDYGLIQKAQWPITALGVHCVVYEVPAPQSVDRILRKLGDDERVESAQSMRTFHVMSTTLPAGPGYNDPYLRMQTGLQSIRVENAHHYATGRNVTVAVIDTGADDQHIELKGRVISTESFVPTSRATASDIHGTAVAGIIAATAGNGQGIVGVAPGASLRIMKACWQSRARMPDAQCNTFTLALALNTAIDAKPEIINMSLNGPADPLLERLIARALGDGIIVVASEADTPGSDNEFPAAIPGVIAVRTASAMPSSSRRAGHSIAAPGTEILTTVPHDAYGFMTGSSFAAAHVSGLIALLLELKPHLRSEQIGSLLSASSMKAGACLSCIDACNAVAGLVERSGSCAPAAQRYPVATGRTTF